MPYKNIDPEDGKINYGTEEKMTPESGKSITEPGAPAPAPAAAAAATAAPSGGALGVNKMTEEEQVPLFEIPSGDRRERIMWGICLPLRVVCYYTMPSGLSVLFLIPQGYWLMRSQFSTVFRMVVAALIRELTAVFGVFISPGTLLFFIRLFMFIVANNFLGLTPYVFTASRHLRFTLSLALPLWLGRMVYSLVKQ